MSDLISRLADRDPSVPLALAALAREAGDDGGVDLPTLGASYRETVMTAREAADEAGPELSSDEVHENLTRSVLPRLADEGWIAPVHSGEWTRVSAVGPWWEEARGDRSAMRSRLLAAGVEGLKRRASQAQVSHGPLPGGSILEGNGLSKSFRRRRVVDRVSVHLEQGEIVGLLGPNGAGKTTTFYLLTGLIRPDEGKVTLDGIDLSFAPMYQRARRGLGYLAQEPSVFRRLTVEENILAILETLRLSRDERRQRLETLLDELSIKHLRKSKAYSLSGGERRRLEITRALVTRPKFMLLDEPFAGVDPIAVHDIQTIVAGLRHRGIGVLITDHNVEQTLDIVDRAYIMFEGKVQVAGPVRDLVFDDRVAQLYLGPTLTARLRARLEKVA
ncbi:MAG TPA: LPS export ABC transporter ATP-binding protein [Gemmatimonadales bacterium]|jgi:lipopolysaccharide export system ATP-binding protein|nr:LPS export ABC transporter ATP-binding protein [Gemmatimonadales bacterium]